MRALNIAASGMQAQQKNLDVISNNIANLSTPAFKRGRAEFSDLIYQSDTRMGTASAADGTIIPTGVQYGLGVKIGSTYRIHEQGAFQETGNVFDIAINGAGYFQVVQPNGEIAYTRAGQFNLNDQGELVNSLGFIIEPNIVIPQEAESIDISPEGEVFASFGDEVEAQNLGQLELAVFVNEAGLRAIGNNLYTETEASGPPLLDFPGTQNFGNLLQGFLEASNVDSVTEITSLITAQRAFEFNSRVITASDEMLQTINNVR